MSKKEMQPDSQNEDSGGFSFEPLPAGDESGRSEAFKQEEQLRESLASSTKSPQKKGSMVRLILLVFMLFLLIGAGAYFFMGMEEPPPPQPIAVKKKPVTVPPKPAPVKKVVQETPAEPPKEVKKDIVKEVPAKAEKSPVKEDTLSVPVAKISPDLEMNKTSVYTPAGTKRYTVQAGAFLLESNLDRSRKKIRKLGFDPVVKRLKKDVKMTRLRVGAYPMREANNKLAQIKEFAPDAFLVKEGDLYVVYAGVYHDLDKARSFADRLYEKGIILEEESVMLPQPLNVLSFGEFSDLESARAAADRAKQIGMDVFVSKIR